MVAGGEIMASTGISTYHLDYLQRNFDLPPLTPGQPTTSANVALRRMLRVRGLGRLVGEPKNPPGATQPSLLMRDALIGMYGYKIPVAFIVHGSPFGVTIRMGIWSPSERERVTERTLDSRVEILSSVLGSLYPAVDLEPCGADVAPFPIGGIALGLPSAKPPESMQGALPVDRLIRAVYGCNWAYVVLADPIDEGVLADIRNSIINEERLVQVATESLAAPSPLSQLYQQLLEIHLFTLTQGQAEGGWRTGVYLLGDASSYYRLASVWRSTFSGDESIPEPVRVWRAGRAVNLATDWSLPDVEGIPGPGNYRHPFSFQTALTSSQLANYIHLPQNETSGFSIHLVADFDSMPPDIAEPDGLGLGQVIDRTYPTQTIYRIGQSMLNRHALIAGVTGGGKTNTVFHLLAQLWDRKIPFLVLEPAKTEYRALIDHTAIGPELRVFTPGDENVSPLRINPFEVEANIPISAHIDLLKSVFNASFGMWNPLPQILERCLHEVYLDCGWDPTRGLNDRLEDDATSGRSRRPQAFPTLSQLYLKTEEVVESLGYEERVTSDMKAALVTRLNGLRIGTKGTMLDTRFSVPVEELLSRPTIVELEAIGDDEEKAFIMGVLMVRIYEYLRGRGATEGVRLKHLTVIEEAHRLLSNTAPSTDPERPNMGGKAVETFANMLSEVRAYGESFLVAEQIPSKLSPDVIKNTNLKIIHRVVAGDDRVILGKTMNMADHQIEMLATLRTGQAAVFAEGDDKPLLVQVPYAKLVAHESMSTKYKSDARVADRMAGFRVQDSVSRAYTPHALCASACKQPYRYCDDAKGLVEQKHFQVQFSGLALTTLLEPSSLAECCSELLTTVRSHLPRRSLEPGAFFCVLFNAVQWYITHFGRHYHWKYSDAESLGDLMSRSLAETTSGLLDLDSSGFRGSSEKLEEFSHLYHSACRRGQDPFPACREVCPSGECLFRYHVQMLNDNTSLSEAFNLAMAKAGTEGTWEDVSPLHDVVSILGGEDFAAEDQRSMGLCYGIQRIAFFPGLLEAARKLANQDLIAGYDAGE